MYSIFCSILLVAINWVIYSYKNTVETNNKCVCFFVYFRLVSAHVNKCEGEEKRKTNSSNSVYHERNVTFLDEMCLVEKKKIKSLIAVNLIQFLKSKKKKKKKKGPTYVYLWRWTHFGSVLRILNWQKIFFFLYLSMRSMTLVNISIWLEKQMVLENACCVINIKTLHTPMLLSGINEVLCK